MYSRLFKCWTLISLLIINSLVFGQGVSIFIEADPRLSESQIIYLSDFDFLNEGRIAEQLFRIHITSDADYSNCVMKIRLMRGSDQLAFVETQRFNLPMGTHTISNVDLVDQRFVFAGETEPIRISDSGIAEDAVKDLTDELFASGRLPVGYYDLIVELTYSSTLQAPPADLPFFITNPTMVNLVSPGGPVGMGTVPEVYNEFPVFQWNGNSRNYQVLVFEQKSEFQSLDDILNTFPNWQSERLDVLNIQYPSIGTGAHPVLPLQFGKTYFWLVKMFVQTSSGENEIMSEVWNFKMVDPSRLTDTPDHLAMEDIQRLLSDLLGTQQAEQIAKGVSGFWLKSIRVNGRPITVQELYQIIDQYRGQELQILDLIMQQSN